MVNIRIQKPQFDDITISWLYNGKEIVINRCLPYKDADDRFIRGHVIKSIVHEMLHHILYKEVDDNTSDLFDKLTMKYGFDLFDFKNRNTEDWILDLLYLVSKEKVRKLNDKEIQ